MTGGGPGVTLAQARLQAARRLAEAGIAQAAFEARLLVAHAAGCPPEDLIRDPDRLVPAEASDRLAALVERRAQNEPVAYLTGHREFWSLDLEVTPDTLIPRPDSETLIQSALCSLETGKPVRRILDLGTGSGCLLLALLSECPGAWGLGVDINADAIAVARRNAWRVGLKDRAHFAAGNWADAVSGEFDVVLANPPYIGHNEMTKLPDSVRRFEPARALDGGPDGLDCIRRILNDLPRLLTSGGIAVMEFGADQKADVADLVEREPKLNEPAFFQDLEDRTRCVVLQFEPRRKAGRALKKA